MANEQIKSTSKAVKSAAGSDGRSEPSTTIAHCEKSPSGQQSPTLQEAETSQQGVPDTPISSVKPDAVSIPVPIVPSVSDRPPVKVDIKTFKPTLKTAPVATLKTATAALATTSKSLAFQSAQESESAPATALVGGVAAPVRGVANTATKVLDKTGHNTLSKSTKSIAVAAGVADLLAAKTDAEQPENAPADVVSASVGRVVSAAGKKSLSKVLHPIKTVKTAKDATQSAALSVKSVKPSLKTVKSTSITGAKSIKAAFKTASQSIKTTTATAKATGITSKATVSAARRSAVVAKDAAVTTAKATAKTIKALIGAVKAAVDSINAIVAAIAAGGWIAVVAVLGSVLVVAICGSAFSIFFADNNSAGPTIASVVNEIYDDYAEKMIDIVQNSSGFEYVVTEGAAPSWQDILSIYAVKVSLDPDNPDEVATMSASKANKLKGVFWDMVSFSSSIENRPVPHIISSWNESTGKWESVTTQVSTPFLVIKVSVKDADTMATQYHFNADQKSILQELLDSSEIGSLLTVALGDTSGHKAILKVAKQQIGVADELRFLDVFSETWSYTADFYSAFPIWCSNKAGITTNTQDIDLEKFLSVDQSFAWFKYNLGGANARTTSASRLQPGDFVLFDAEYDDGMVDNVGIVESIDRDSNKVSVIMRDSSRVVHRVTYSLNDATIEKFLTY